MNISFVGISFLALTTVVLPIAAIKSAQKLKRPGGIPARSALLVSVLVQQSINVTIALLVASYEGIFLFPDPAFNLSVLGYAVGFLVVGLGTIPMRWNWRSQEEKKKLLWRIPNKPSDIWGWGLLSFGAGTTEEIIFRGVMFQLWQRVIPGFWPSALICSVAFALAHYLQGWRSMAVIFVMALGAHGLVLATGDLYTVMAVHVIYDLLAGVVFLSLAKKEGLLDSAA